MTQRYLAFCFLTFLSCLKADTDASECVKACRVDAGVCLDGSEACLDDCHADEACIKGCAAEMNDCLLGVLDCLGVCVEKVEKKLD